MLKVKCSHCGVDILQSTYDKHDGICAPCYKRKEQDEQVRRFISTPGCPNCDGSRYISFSWKKVTDIKNKFNKYAKYILPSKKLKYGTLYKCKNCKVSWWLDVKHSSMHLITQDRLPILEKWNNKRYTLSINQLIKLSKIKKTPTDIYRKSEFIIFPCSVITNSDMHYAKSIIKITNLPPLYENPSFVLFADEIKNIIPSPYSLPISVRKATSLAQEVRMCFSPAVTHQASLPAGFSTPISHFTKPMHQITVFTEYGLVNKVFLQFNYTTSKATPRLHQPI